MQAIWSGSLAFGTIMIPVRMYSASDELRVPFHMVHAEDGGRVRYKKVCDVDGKELHISDIRKGYQIGDRMVQFTDEELEELKPVMSKSLKVLGFCGKEEVPLIALEKPYYLGTESRKKGAGKPFALLRKAMENSGKAAIVSWVTRSSEQIGMMVPYEKGFMIKGLLYLQQIKPFEKVEIMDEAVDEELVEKGMMLIEKMTFGFDYGSYQENYSLTLKEIIEAKALGKEIKPEHAVKTPETRSLEAELARMLA